MSAQAPMSPFEQVVDEYINDKLLTVRRDITPKAMAIIAKAVLDIDNLCPNAKREQELSWKATNWHSCLTASCQSLTTLAAKVQPGPAAEIGKIIADIQAALKAGGK